jgi:hypothetical protein
LHFEFTPSSRSRHLVLYDPGAVPDGFPVDPDTATPEPQAPPREALEALAAESRALVVNITAGECAASLRVYVDEDAPAELAARSAENGRLRGARLRVPGGRLLADGAEFIQRAGTEREWASKERAELPAGEYDLEAFHIMEWKQKHRKAGIASGASPLARCLDWIAGRVELARIVLVITNVAVIPLLVLSATSGDWRTALMGLGSLLAADVVLVGIFWLMSSVLRRAPGRHQVQKAEELFDRDNPDLVVVLRSAGDRAGGGEPSPAFLRVSP